jgi:hypothetical protein
MRKSTAAEHRAHPKTQARIERRKLRWLLGRGAAAPFLGAGTCQLRVSVEFGDFAKSIHAAFSRALEQRMPPQDLCRKLQCLLRVQP